MQAQEFGPAKWALAQRADGVTVADVEAAFEAGTLLRLHILRPTWHFVHADDLRWMLRVSAPRVHKANAYHYRVTGVDDDVARRSRVILEKVLADGRHATRKEIAAILAAADLPSAGVPLVATMMRAELDGVIVSGVMQGKQHTYALVDARVPAGAEPDEDEALAELTRRYLVMRGPATVKDYATWASLTVTDARRGLAMLADAVVSEEIGGRQYWSLAGDHRSTALKRPVVDLVQCYDEVVMGYSESRDVVVPPDRLLGAWQARWHAVLLDGHVVGQWRFTVGRDGVAVETDMWRTFTSAERAVMTNAVDRLGGYFGRTATWG